MPRHQHAILLTIPGLRPADLSAMPRLASLAQGSGMAGAIAPSFPCVTCPVQANLTTGVGPEKHGVIANGFFHRGAEGTNRRGGPVEMWTAWNECITAPQIWQILKERDPALTSLVWFPLHSKGARADWICTPAPVHNPDGSESLWCYTRPELMYGTLRDKFGHFPLMNFWGPLASIKSTDWIVDSAAFAIAEHHPRFSYLYLPHPDYASQKFGPDSPQALTALSELDAAIGRLMDRAQAALPDLLWVVASEYAITPVSSVSYPNRFLREAGWLHLDVRDGLEYLDPTKSRAWALVDHQFAHLFVQNPSDIPAVAELMKRCPGVETVLVGPDRAKYGVEHPRSGDIVLISQPDQWFAYYWWLDDALAPSFARTVDIHRKPGYDPVELFVDMPARNIPLNANLVKGSHGYPARDASRHGLFVCSDAACLPNSGNVPLIDTDVAGIILKNFEA